MFEDYIFGLTVDPDGMSDHDDPPISPTSPSACHNGRYSLAAAPARPAHPLASDITVHGLAENEGIDRLAHELREQASISGRQARIQSSRILPEDSSECLVARGCARIQHAGGPVATFRTQPPTNHKGDRPQASYRQRAEGISQPELTGPGTDPSSEAISSRRLRRQTDPRPQQQQHNHPCLENLLTNMVEHEVQCNVQGATLEPPVLTTRPSLLRIPPPPAAAVSSTTTTTTSSGLADFDHLMDLEVDTNYCEGADENLLDDTIALREAGAPTGVKKPGTTLRYRTSMDVGVQCRNMKRNIPRMRRRKPKTKPYAPPAEPAGTAATAATTTT
ncbi:hypothetical protein SLS62_001941 [Diatrype stigma]|uniref:Uncharacterized protein n=1 Tax=Diatrype stigma TaxID=117547 RepID=A0AAN9UXA4_9PEZI